MPFTDGRVVFITPTSNDTWIDGHGEIVLVPNTPNGVRGGRRLSELEANKNRTFGSLRSCVERSFLSKCH